MTIFRIAPVARYGGLALGLMTALIAQAASPPLLRAPPQNVINLGVAASREVLQDTLSISMAVAREGADASAVQTELRQVLEAGLTQARKAVRPGMLEVRTGAFSISPRYVSRPGGGSAQNGWQGRAELVIEGRDTSAVSQLAGRLTGLTVARVTFSLSREARERVEAEVESEAISRFRSRAESYAQQFGFGGYTLREVAVSGGDPGSAPVQMLRSAPMAAARGPEEFQPVEPGRATVSVTVSGSIQLLPK